jgi:hypothetical protein
VRWGLGGELIARIRAWRGYQRVVIVSSIRGTARALTHLEGNRGSAFQTDRSARNRKKNLEQGSLRKEDKPITERRWRSSIETTRIDDKGHERRIETFESKVTGDRPAGDPLEKSFTKQVTRGSGIGTKVDGLQPICRETTTELHREQMIE